MEFREAYSPHSFFRTVTLQAVEDGCRFELYHSHGWYLVIAQATGESTASFNRAWAAAEAGAGEVPSLSECPSAWKVVGTVSAEAYASNFSRETMEAWAAQIAIRWMAGGPVYSTEPVPRSVVRNKPVC